MYPDVLFFLWFGFTVVKFITCYSDGSLLTEECQGMNIVHYNNLKQIISYTDSACPFTVTPDQMTFNDLQVGHEINVTLSGTETDTFMGFLLEARKCEDCPPAGTFSLTDTSKTVLLTCDGQNGRAVSHTDNLEKSSITVKWIVPEEGTFFFRAAVTKTFDTFWGRKPITTANSIGKTSEISAANSNTRIVINPYNNAVIDSKTSSSIHTIFTVNISAVLTSNIPAYINAVFNVNFTISTAVIHTQTVYVIMVSIIIHYCFFGSMHFK
ncbi:ferric-chelate reductase 1-like [Misgurnus anguillicaudatus]|uniref:ferric-chelate reductase 1-like n=1 Tax=Misgurnus anguillicaudatus TaxID=75329 RepID=UPI003CCF1AFD